VPHPINRSDDPASSHILNSEYVTIRTVPKLRTEAWEINFSFFGF